MGTVISIIMAILSLFILFGGEILLYIALVAIYVSLRDEDEEQKDI